MLTTSTFTDGSFGGWFRLFHPMLSWPKPLRVPQLRVVRNNREQVHDGSSGAPGGSYSCRRDAHRVSKRCKR